MIDGIKCTVHGVQPARLKERLEFFLPVTESTGEAMPYSYARLDNFRISLNQQGTCSMRGSLHKYAHGGMNNTDFSHSDLVECISSLGDLFETGLENFVLHNVEFGVNLDYPPAEICDNLVLFGANPFTAMSANTRLSRGMSCKLDRYSFKIYGKAQTMLRVETQVKKMQFVHPVMLNSLLTFERLTDKTVLASFGAMLHDTWGKVLLREELILPEIKPKSKELVSLGQYPGYWMDLKKSNPENFKKQRNRFVELQQEFKTTNRKEDVGVLILEKWQSLLNG